MSVGIGLSYAAKLARRDNRVFALLSDGECNEGSVWEGSNAGQCPEIGSLGCHRDYNKWQATGRSQDVMALEPLAEKWQCVWLAYHRSRRTRLRSTVRSLSGATRRQKSRPLSSLIPLKVRASLSWKTITIGIIPNSGGDGVVSFYGAGLS